ncbi:HAMP domain-containing histidine kinase [Candidatus Saccharibacteria bacterium]|nr:HAMP domain-containing histidine kinase [Candidatus Saccharibacteria bacterium]MCB9821040.1 HAMP domain-containing histidine kinase [Candidatus Nomurabacteria bacterium]
MFRSAVLKLTLFYFSILLAVVLFLSFNWYRVAIREIDRVDSALQGNEIVLRRRGNIFSDDLEEVVTTRQQAIEISKHEIKTEILTINAFLLSAGGLGAYLLAWRTLEPIENSHKALERFTSDASHELRTPLTAMQIEIETTLRSKHSDKAELAELVASNLEEVKHMTSLVENLLLLTRNQALILEDSRTDNLANKALQDTKSARQAKKISVTKAIDSARVHVNSPSVIQILTILLDNAIKYSPEGSKIELAGKAKGRNYTFTVTDQGSGIAKAEQSKIFERFFRAESSRTSYGFGLGLSIAQKLAEQNHGELKLTKTGPAGTSFCLQIPLA